ncbi:MAG: PKD domain-containing protein, partial [Bacteroidetes bacterium]
TPTAGVYANPGSGQFISKLTPSLNAIVYATVLGNGTPNTLSNQFSPSAFMVDVCENIYASGWGLTNSYPVSANAVQSTTDGEDFYLIVLGKNAGTLIYATYYGENGEWEHVDGGTSRFDKKGQIYQSVCTIGTAFPVTPGAFSPNNKTGGDYDIAVFKIDFQSVGVTAQAQASPNDTICGGGSVSFVNTSVNAVDYIWNFGDGGPVSSASAPTHAYTSSGTYTATLVAIDSSGCNVADTFFLIITVLPQPLTVATGDTICQGETATLLASGGNTYQWSNGATGSAITVNPTVTTSYTVTVSNSMCMNDTAVMAIVTPSSVAAAYSNVTITQGQSASLSATGGGTYSWSPSSGLSCTDCPDPIASPGQTTFYCVFVTNAAGCSDSACVTVNVEIPPCGDIFVPNVFSPNNDGANELECVLGGCIKELQFIIYNRWGEKVFETTGSPLPSGGPGWACWDGTYKGKLMNTAVFVYYLDVTLTSGEKVSKKGNVSLMR